MKIFAGSASKKFIERFWNTIHKDNFGSVETQKFPDGEIHVKFCDNIRGKDVFLVQSMGNPVNDNLMELLIMIDAAKRASASRVTAVIPFFAYARQDRKEQPRVPITAKMVANLFVSAGADRILTMDLHSPQIQGFWDIPVDHLQAAPAFIHFIKGARKFLHGNALGECEGIGTLAEDIVVVAPDTGRSKVAAQYARALGCGLAIVNKERIDAETTTQFALVGNVENKTAILIDDMSTTGGTLVGAADILRKNGVKNIVAGITHNILTEQGIRKIEESSIDKLLVTDTVEREIKGKMHLVSVAEMFAKAILGVHHNQSVSALFDL